MSKINILDDDIYYEEYDISNDISDDIYDDISEILLQENNESICCAIGKYIINFFIKLFNPLMT